MSIYKVVGRFKSKEEMNSWDHGKPFTQAKKSVYISKEDYERYSPDLIRRWTQNYNYKVEVYIQENGKWKQLSIKDN